MSIRIHVPEPLRRYSGGLGAFDVDGATVGAALAALFEQMPELRSRVLDAAGRVHPYLFLLHGRDELPRDGFADRVLAAGDELDIIPAVEGGAPSRDVRMRGFKERVTVDEARRRVMTPVDRRLESMGLSELSGRVLARDVVSAFDVPAFDRSAMDGYAVRAEDTHGADAWSPIRLRLVGEAMPGTCTPRAVGPGEAIRIMTGAPLPAGADAVVRAEYAREERIADAVGIVVEAPVAVLADIGRRGEDVRSGDVVLRRGRVLRPQDLGLLASIGVAEAEVVARPRVAILVSGNELLPAGAAPLPGHIVDSNTPMLRALVERDGGRVVCVSRLRDDEDELRRALVERDDADVVIAAGGSSVGREDFLPQLVAAEGELVFHGVAMRPSSPTGFGRVGGRPVFLLPGNPVSCLCAYEFFAGPHLRARGGRSIDWPHPRRLARLGARIVSEPGRVDYVRVTLDDEIVQPLAVRGAAILSSTTRAAGFVIIDGDSEGLDEGAEVEVFLYDRER